MTVRAAPRSPRTLGRRLAALGLGLLGLPLLLELGLRLAGFHFPPLEAPIVFWDSQNDAEMRAGEGLHEIDLRCLWRPRPGAAVPEVPGERVNELGLRGPLPAAEPSTSTLRLVTLGDSSTFGWKTPYAQTYSGLLAQRLGAGAPAEVLAAGVIGYTAVQGRVRFETLIAPLRPTVAVVAFGAINEHFPSDVGGDRERLALQAARASALHRARRWLLEHWTAAQLCASWAEGGERGRAVAVARWVEERGRYDAAWAERGSLSFRGARRVEPGEFGPVLGELVDSIEASGAAVVLVAMPRRLDCERELPVLVEYDRALRAFAAARGLPLCDAHAAFRERAADDLLFLDSVHPSAAGHALLAERLEPLVRAAAAQRARAGAIVPTGRPAPR
jgi:lysophospholipase L1-like esterase